MLHTEQLSIARVYLCLVLVLLLLLMLLLHTSKGEREGQSFTCIYWLPSTDRYVKLQSHLHLLSMRACSSTGWPAVMRVQAAVMQEVIA
jgi:hypothetical protein